LRTRQYRAAAFPRQPQTYPAVAANVQLVRLPRA